MNSQFYRACSIGIIVTLIGLQTYAAGQPQAGHDALPMRLTHTLHSREGFEPLEPWAASFVVRGGDKHAYRDIFDGDLDVGLYESKDEKVRLEKQPYDEFVYVVRGEAVLTPEGHEAQHYRSGDFFLVPKGYTGTWETKNDYRELVVVEAASSARAEKYWLKGLPDPSTDNH